MDLRWWSSPARLSFPISSGIPIPHPNPPCQLRQLESSRHDSFPGSRRAADLGAKLTGQLLTVSRRQRRSPKLVNANELISEFQGLIRQAVGGACDVKLLTDRPLWLCHVDPPLLKSALLRRTQIEPAALRR